MKKQGTFRSHCAFCKAEFCHEDIVLLPSVPQETVAVAVSPPQQQPKAKKAKKKKNRRKKPAQ